MRYNTASDRRKPLQSVHRATTPQIAAQRLSLRASLQNPIPQLNNPSSILTAGRVPEIAREVRGFTLVEVLAALLILSYGLLSVGQLIFHSVSSLSLARYKENAIVLAQNKLTTLGSLYRRDPSHASLAAGVHGPEEISLQNPLNNNVINRFRLHWNVSPLLHPRPHTLRKKALKGRKVTVSVSPISTLGDLNKKTNLNNVTSITAVLGPKDR